jgi:hypothetical protein
LGHFSRGIPRHGLKENPDYPGVVLSSPGSPQPKTLAAHARRSGPETHSGSFQSAAMVWFQCDDCGADLKKPKLAAHFRSCSAYKVSPPPAPPSLGVNLVLIIGFVTCEWLVCFCAAFLHRLRRGLQPGHRPGAHPVHLRGREFHCSSPCVKFTLSFCDSTEA